MKSRRNIKNKTERKKALKKTGKVALPVKVKKSAARSSSGIHGAKRESTPGSANMAKAAVQADSQAKARNTVLGIIKANRKRDQAKEKYAANLLYQDKPAKAKFEIKDKTVENIKEDQSFSRETNTSNARIEKDKRLMMWAGVTFFMVLIASAWIYNTKKTFERSRLENDNSLSATQWQDLTAEIDDKIDELKDSLKDIKKFNSTSTEMIGTLPESIATTTNIMPLATSTDAGTTTIISDEQLESLKAKLENGANHEP